MVAREPIFNGGTIPGGAAGGDGADREREEVCVCERERECVRECA